LVDELWQQALDISFQRGLARTLRTPAPPGAQQKPEVQVVFCIDTRSEPMRRSLEAVCPGVQTRAFAGFFGLPIQYNLLGTGIHRPQLPGLAYPSIVVQDVVTGPGDPAIDDDTGSRHVLSARRRRLAQLDQLLGTVRWSN